MPRIALIDDHSMFRDSLAALLAAEPETEVCGSYGGLAEAIAGIARVPPDLVLLDLNLAGERGADFLRWSQETFPHVRVLIVTAQATPEEARGLLSRGACGVMFKNSSATELLAAIGCALSGTTVLNAGLDQQLWSADAESDSFSPRERHVFLAMYAGKSNKEIANGLEISEAAVKATLQRIFDKTGVRTRGQLVRAALESYPALFNHPDDSDAQ